MTRKLAAPTTEAQYLEVSGTLNVTEDGRRELTGLFVTHDEFDRPDWYWETERQVIDPGAVTLRDKTFLCYGHDLMAGGMPIGRVIEAEDTPEGTRGTVRISRTTKGDDVLALATPDDDGVAVLDRFSIGFYSTAQAVDPDDPHLLHHTSIDVFEVSVVPIPQLEGAAVSGVLSRPTSATNQEHHMPEPDQPTPASAAEVATLAASIDTLERRIATLGAADPGDSRPAVPGASYGEFLQLAAAADPAALEFLAYVGGTTGDLGDLLKDSWVGERYRAVEAQRTVLNFFARSPLPATGLGVEYGTEGTDTTQVTEQAAEGDVLAKGKITFATARAELKTYGGWGEMTRKEIERAPINVVERFYTALLRRYARTTEAVVSARAVAAGTTLAGGVLDLDTTDGWTKFTIRAARRLKDIGYPLEGILVGFDVFEDLAVLREGDNPTAPRFLDRNTGSINVTGLSGEMFTVPVIPIETGATTGVVRAGHHEAIRSYEASGAPFRLQDDDITNLTKAFSVYGYMATAPEVPAALIKPATV